MAARLLLAGYFGAGNLGDDAILLGFLKAAESLAVDVTVMSGHPEETSRYYGVRAIPRKDLKVFSDEMAQHDALVFPGGSIFQDSSSMLSPQFYQRLVSGAKKSGKKVVFLAQGVGPLNSFLGKQAAKSAFAAADAISVRDPQSTAELKKLGVRVPVFPAADFAFLLPKPEKAEDDYGFGNMPAIGIAPRPLAKDRGSVAGLFAELCRMLMENNMLPYLVEMDREEDGPLILEVGKLAGGKVPDIRKMITPMQMQQRVQRLHAMIALRLHAGILASTVGVPPFMVSYDPKVAAFAQLLDLPTPPKVEGLNPQRLFESFRAFLADRDRIQAAMLRKTEQLRIQAQQNVQLLVDTVPGLRR